MRSNVYSSTPLQWLRASRTQGVLVAALVVLVTAKALCAAGPAAQSAGGTAPPNAGPKRPPIVGIAHVGFKVSDLDATRQFYGNVLGYQEVFEVNRPDGSLILSCFKINERQYLELFPTLKSPNDDRLSHIAFETTDIQALRDYLAARGAKVPDQLKPWLDGNVSFTVSDPDGHRIEFTQYMPNSRHVLSAGKFLPDTRISDHIQHAGVTVKDRAAADKFYKDILGFRVGWSGGKTDEATDCVDMVVPEGKDFLEYMMNVNDLTPQQLGVMNHVSLRVPDVQAGEKTLIGRGYKAGERMMACDGRPQLNLFDPDMTRVELKEPKPVQTPCCSPMPDFQQTPGAR